MTTEQTNNSQEGAAGHVPLEGALGLKAARGIRDVLRQAFDASRSIVVDARAVTGVDISVIQLLIAARHSADREGKSFTLLGDPAGPLATMVAEAGLAEELAMHAG